MTWLDCAKSHGLTIAYLGGRNEKGHNKTWSENLRATLNAKGYGAIKIVRDDSVGWKVADDMVADPAFKAAVDVVGVHYPCGYKSASTTCNSTANAIATGRPLWASENGSLDMDSGAAALIRSIATRTTLASGTTSAPGLGTWHTLTLDLRGTITARIDQTTLATVHDSSYAAGQVGFGVVGYPTDQFDNLSVTGATATDAGPITSGVAGKCLAAQNNGSANGTPVVIDACTAGDPAQQWTVAGDTIQINGACLEVTGKGTAKRGARRAVDLQRRYQPAVDRRGQLLPGGYRLREVPRRPGQQHGERYPAGDLDL